MRRSLLAALLSLPLLVGACGGSDDDSPPPSSKGGGPTLEELWQGSGENVTTIPGTGHYSPGLVRFSFLVVRSNAELVLQPKAQVWVAEDREAAPFVRTSARLEPVGVPGGYKDDHGVTHLYVAHLQLDRPGMYWFLAEPVGGRPIRALGNLEVKDDQSTPAVGDKAFPSRTPTLDSEDGDLEALTTRDPPDRELLRYSVADSIAAHNPFVVTFATPKFCTSRTCGPVVDVVDSVRKRFQGSGIRFIHVEIYEGNNPALGPNRWFREWGLPGEPWTFLVGGDGRVKARFEGSLSVAELQAAVRRHLAG